MASGSVSKILLVMFCFCGSAVGTRTKLLGAKKDLSAAFDDGICKAVVDRSLPQTSRKAMNYNTTEM